MKTLIPPASTMTGPLHLTQPAQSPSPAMEAERSRTPERMVLNGH